MIPYPIADWSAQSSPADLDCRGSLNDLGSSHLIFNGQAHSPDRPLAFIPNVTVVFLLTIRKRLRYAHGKNKTRTVALIRSPDWEHKLQMFSKKAIYQRADKLGRPVKSKKTDSTDKDTYFLTSLFIRASLRWDKLNQDNGAQRHHNFRHFSSL